VSFPPNRPQIRRRRSAVAACRRSPLLVPHRWPPSLLSPPQVRPLSSPLPPFPSPCSSPFASVAVARSPSPGKQNLVPSPDVDPEDPCRYRSAVDPPSIRRRLPRSVASPLHLQPLKLVCRRRCLSTGARPLLCPLSCTVPCFLDE
jgi:hypothetical protein